MGANESRVDSSTRGDPFARHGARAGAKEQAGLSRLFSIPSIRQPSKTIEYLETPTYLSDRVLAFQHTGSRDETLPAALARAASWLEEAHDCSSVLLVTLTSDLILDRSTYEMFNCVVEFRSAWENPRGVCVGGLDVILSACSSAKAWLSMSESNVVCFFTRAETSSSVEAQSMVRFLAACLGLYMSESDISIDAALGELAKVPPRAKSHVTAKALTQAQRRYGDYVRSVVEKMRSEPSTSTSPTYPSFSIKRLVLAGGISVERGGWRPYARVSNDGHVVGKSLTQGFAPDWHASNVKHGLVPIGIELVDTARMNTSAQSSKPGIPINGDVVISVYHWTGDEERDEEYPVMTFAFHTGHVETGVLRVTRAQMDCSDDMLIPDDYFIDITLLDNIPQAKTKRGTSISVQTSDSAQTPPLAPRAPPIPPPPPPPRSGVTATPIAVPPAPPPPAPRGVANAKSAPPPLPPPPPPRFGAGGRAPPAPPPPFKAAVVATPIPQGPNLRKIYWDKLAVTNSTWWAEGLDAALSEDEKQSIIKSFEIKPMLKKKPSLDIKPKATTGMPTLIPLPRANNISIMLSRFPIGAKDICEAISTGDPSEELTLERLAILLQCEPTDEELGIMRHFSGDAEKLLVSEKFLLDLSKIDRLREKVAALVYVRQFPELITEAHSGLDAINDACEQVSNAKSFRRLLALVLEVGNFLNAGGPRSSTKGVTLDSLHKLADVRTTAPSNKGGALTLLDFIMELFDEREKANGPLHLTSELSACQAASRVARVELEGTIRKVVVGAKSVREEASASHITSFDALLVNLDDQVEKLEKRAGEVDAAFDRVAVLVGESRRAPEDIFASLWSFACACDASRASREHRASSKRK